ncbi:Protein YceI [Dyadobacter sp. CECT 9275]|uniref:Protein YceI n=1 Tax=Dyadobacter helix TaxID=2822344 RepID=A0A916JHH0_9BACT|nr:YceI family protein [Dyadobacter sp. CECT 9275]CAG5017436.1 Protein YceI [Dyadobacter sp. CECT 9275]
MIKSKILLICLSVYCLGVHAQSLKISAKDSEVKFVIKNLGVSTTGQFKDIEGSIEFVTSDLSRSSFNVTVLTNSLDTDNNLRDKHLSKDGYFDTAKYPRMRFISAKVTGKQGNYVMEGNLTIKDITKPITFPFTATRQDNGYIFKGSFDLNRRDFGVGGKSLTMSDKLTVNLSVSALK